MHFIEKPAAPALDPPTEEAYALALGNAVGRYCSFCEKALTFRVALFHKRLGVLDAGVALTGEPWGDLLLICGDCIGSMQDFDPDIPYFWPDTKSALEIPFSYERYDNIVFSYYNPYGTLGHRETVSRVLVRVSTQVPELRAAAEATYSLFALNGKYFNGDFSSPAYALPFEEIINKTDLRLDQRFSAYQHGVSSAEALARAIPTTELGSSYLVTLLEMIHSSIASYGYWSTTNAAIRNTLGEEQFQVLLRAVGVPIQSKEADLGLQKGLKRAREVSDKKYKVLTERLAKIIRQ